MTRYELRKSGASFAVARRSEIVTRGAGRDFHPSALAVISDGMGLWLVDEASGVDPAQRARSGRLYRLTYTGSDRKPQSPKPQGDDTQVRISALDHPASLVRLESQRIVAGQGEAAIPGLTRRLKTPEPETGRLHALWALDAIGTTMAQGGDSRSPFRSLAADPASGSPECRDQDGSAGVQGT